MQTIKYKDLDMNMRAHPVTGALFTLTNNKAIQQSIKNLIQTEFYDFGFNS